MMEIGKEPDLIKNSLKPSQSTDDLDLDKCTLPSKGYGSTTDEFGPNLIQLRVTQQIRELQTVIRDKCVYSCSRKVIF